MRNITNHRSGLRRRNPYGSQYFAGRANPSSYMPWRRNPEALCTNCGVNFDCESFEDTLCGDCSGSFRSNPDICNHCGKFSCDCASQMPGWTMAPDLVGDPRAIECHCGQLLYPGEVCRCKFQRNPYRRNPEVNIIFKMNVKTGKKDIIIDVHSDDDTLPHEHEKAHRKLVEQLIGNGVISAAEVGEVTVKRGGKAPPPLKGREEPPAGEKAAISTRRRRNPLNKDDFEVANERRLDLIHKSIDGELTADEEVELEKLQKLTAEYINRQHPLPFDRLAELEEKVRKYQKPRRNPRGACKKRKTRSDKGKSRKKYKRRGRK